MNHGCPLENGSKRLENLLNNKLKQLKILILCACIILFAFGCSMKRPLPETFPERHVQSHGKLERVEPVSPQAQPPKAVMAPEVAQLPETVQRPELKPSARMMATANLVEQGKNYLDKGKPDQALGVFERALSVYPGNGETYYYMAEAWVMKKNKHQALEFNRLANMYLSGDYQWCDKVADQHVRIKRLP